MKVVKEKKKDTTMVYTKPDGTQGTKEINFDDYLKEQREMFKKDTIELVKQMNGMNLDMSLIQKPDYQSKNHNVGGKKFQMNFWCGDDNKVVQRVQKSKKRFELKSVVQLWNRYKSVILIFTQDELTDGRINWNHEFCIPQDDLVSQTLSTFGLKYGSVSPTMMEIGKGIKDENDREDEKNGIPVEEWRFYQVHQVWD
jgi:hypothetical protein